MLVLILVIGVSRMSGKDELAEPKDVVEQGKQAVPTAVERKLTIYAPGVEDAVLVLANGMEFPLPYVIHGRNGEIVEFTIRAEGYVEKQEIIELNHRRNSFESNLQKINE
jgi:hypothetical protein